ncbi:hypothetical protein VPZ60_004306 [Salmonella enterica]|nr:hypothetical protein [Salmonella enterica]
MAIKPPTLTELKTARSQLEMVRIMLDCHKTKDRAQNELRSRFSNQPEAIKHIVSVALHTYSMNWQQYRQHLISKVNYLDELITHFAKRTTR